ncbi:hypothetical protein KFL_000540280 [Klebsormidium nitens]|uniref:Uncharacterized protein n=1 Tax=Klebsormidium nitens TaxID=105231 RepID=A0A0U9HIF4_KLENI|nr:hypothetical protein KFL_000540280 [Klebsormidium nitens]|eukprot:GAQ80453.1 hypothetical protein KFL_000540280 [Klebsormidium nitens]
MARTSFHDPSSSDATSEPNHAEMLDLLTRRIEAVERQQADASEAATPPPAPATRPAARTVEAEELPGEQPAAAPGRPITNRLRKQQDKLKGRGGHKLTDAAQRGQADAVHALVKHYVKLFIACQDSVPQTPRYVKARGITMRHERPVQEDWLN